MTLPSWSEHFNGERQTGKTSKIYRGSACEKRRRKSGAVGRGQRVESRGEGHLLGRGGQGEPRHAGLLTQQWGPRHVDAETETAGGERRAGGQQGGRAAAGLGT